jgi:hypothetical protein
MIGGMIKKRSPNLLTFNYHKIIECYRKAHNYTGSCATFFGLPPFLPLLRAASALTEEVDLPPLRPNSVIQDFVPKMPATRPVISKSASKLSQCTLLPDASSQTSLRASCEACSSPCVKLGGKLKKAPFFRAITTRLDA